MADIAQAPAEVANDNLFISRYANELLLLINKNWKCVPILVAQEQTISSFLRQPKINIVINFYEDVRSDGC